MRPRTAALSLVAAAGFACAPALAAPLHDALACPSAAQVQSALERRAPGLEGEVWLQGAGPRSLELRWEVGGRRFVRELPRSPRDCAAAAQTVALLLQAWRRALPARTADDPLAAASRIAPRPHLPAPDGGAPAAPLESRATPPVPEAHAEADAGSLESQTIAPATVDAGPPMPVLVPGAEDAGAPEDGGFPEPRGVDGRRPPWHLELALAGRGAAGVDAALSSGGGTLGLALGLGEPAVAVELQLGVDAPVHAAAGPGTALARRQTLSLGAALRLRPWPARPWLGLRLAGGPLLERIQATSAGYTTSATATVFNPGLSASGTLELRLGRRVALEAGPQLELLARPTRFQVANVGTLLRFPALWVGGRAGLRVDIL